MFAAVSDVEDGIRDFECQSACKFGSDASLVQLRLFCADQSGLKQIDFPATVHLTSNELEARDLTFSLSIGPGRSDRRPHCGLILGDAIGERSDETGAGSLDPWGKSRFNLPPDHQVEFSDDLARLDQRWCARFDCRDRDGLRLREQVPPDRHETRDRPGRCDPLKGLRVGLFGSSPAGRSLADDAERASEATRR